MRLLKFLLIVLLILFPFGELLRAGITDAITLKPIDLTAGMIAFVVSALIFKKKIYIRLNVLYILFPLFAALSLLFNSFWLHPDDLFASSLYLIRWLSYAAATVAIISVDQQFKKYVLRLMLLDGFIIVLLGYVQYFFYHSLIPLYPLGWDDHMYRMFSVFLDPNFAGGFFVLYFLFIAALIYGILKNKKEGMIMLFTYAKYSRKKQILLLSIIAVASFVAILLTFSRSSLVMLIVSAIVFLVLIRQKKLIAVLILALIAFVLLISSSFYIENVNLFREASSKARLDNYSSALKIIQDKPIFGVGFNSFRYAKEAYGIPMGWAKKPSHADSGVDNSFLFVFATTGIVGLIAYVLLWFGILKRAFTAFRKEENILALTVIASVIGLAFHAMFLNSLFYISIVLWLWLLVGLMWSNK